MGDAETVAGNLTLSKGSTNPALIPTNNIVLGGSGANRTVTVSPASNQFGSATITLTVGDGQYSVSTSFVVNVTAVNDLYDSVRSIHSRYDLSIQDWSNSVAALCDFTVDKTLRSALRQNHVPMA